MMKENQHCKICSSDQTQIITLGKVKLIKCMDCEVYFLKHPPSDEKLISYYRNKYSLTTSSLSTEKRRIFRIPEQIKLISEIMQFFKPPASILEIGCDKGFFLDEARHFGYNVTGVELSKDARYYCKNIGIKVYKNFDQINKKYDIIVLWHSLEHITKPIKLMSTLKEFMTDNAKIFIRVPAFDCLWRKIFKQKWVWFQPNNHYFHYTQKSLRKLLEISGFKALKIESRHPNNRYTKKMYRLVNSIFYCYFNFKIGFLKKILLIFESFTGIELFIIGKINFDLKD